MLVRLPANSDLVERLRCLSGVEIVQMIEQPEALIRRLEEYEAKLVVLPGPPTVPELDMASFMERMCPMELPLDLGFLDIIEPPRMREVPLQRGEALDDLSRLWNLDTLVEIKPPRYDMSGHGPPPGRDAFHGRGQRRERRPLRR